MEYFALPKCSMAENGDLSTTSNVLFPSTASKHHMFIITTTIFSHAHMSSHSLGNELLRARNSLIC